jgi:pathogenesis-related protein 1
MYKKVFKEIIIILVAAVILTAPLSVIQVSHAQVDSEYLQHLQRNAAADLEYIVLDMHNRERDYVGVPALTWSSSLAADAQGYANQLSSQGYVCNAQQCVKNLPRGTTNENIAWGGYDYPIHSMIQSWIDEKERYSPGARYHPPAANIFGHYTAMVWQNTREVGCGISIGEEIAILVCRYSPPGNIDGQTAFG